ncbi:MAG TPA: hypothetical protein IAB66_10120 [Candidatus Caccousia avistercoris]|nr:hypothetical protein [Candidatus Caccousia avistercoris]
MKKVVLTILKIAGIVLLVLILLIAGFLFWLSRRPFVPNNYTETVETGGALEAKYLAMGPYEVKHVKAEAPEDWKEFVAYYPAQLEDSGDQWPAVVFVNGTGVYAAKYPALFRHLASWGFIVLGNEDPGTFSGDSTDATLAWLLEQNGDPDSVFYQKVDTAHMGLSGHSQGGVGVFNAISEQPNGGLYTCAVSLSPTQEDLAAALNIPYDPSKTVIPTLVLAGTSNDVITPEGMEKLYSKLGGPRVMALRTDTDHGSMLYSGDGYVTAWLMYWLRGDEEAGKAFWGEAPELAGNPNWRGVQISRSAGEGTSEDADH